MKKLVSVLLLISMLMCTVIGVFAEDTTTADGADTPAVEDKCVASQENPDWLITEISQDQTGGDLSPVQTYRDPFVGWDIFEYMEIYNNSGRELNLYDYALGYNGTDRDHSNGKFEHEIKEITPFLTNNQYVDAPGNYLDGSVIDGSVEVTKTYGEVSYTMVGVLNETMKNPATCIVAPGECVVLWFVYSEAYRSVLNNVNADNDGCGATVADFRQHWGIPETTKVILVDANSDTKEYGNAHNFNIKNSACGTYSIVKYTEEFVQNCNTPQEDGSQAAGLLLPSYWSSEDVICWASMDIGNNYPLKMGTPNTTTNFVPDVGGYVAKMFGYTWSGARMFPIESDATVSPGYLTDIQKLFIAPETLTPGTAISLSGNNAMGLIYNPELESTETTRYMFYGFNINGQKYTTAETFSVPATGVTEFGFCFEEIAITSEVEETTTEPTDETTADPGNSTTKPSANVTTKPTSDTKVPDTTAAPEEKGCGGVAVAAQVVALVCGVLGFAIIKKVK